MANSWAGNQDRNEEEGGGFAAAGRRVHQLVATGLLAVVKDFLKFCHAGAAMPPSNSHFGPDRDAG